MRPIFTNTATFTTSKRWMVPGGRGQITLPVRCGLCVHPVHGPILIDGGCGPQITDQAGRSLALRLYAWALGPKVQEGQSPVDLLAAREFAPEDVNLIVVTHLHADHVAYLPEFTNARFITDGVTQGKMRHGVYNELLPPKFAAQQVELRSYARLAVPGLGDGYDICGDGSMIGVPLPGHAEGHFGLFFPGDRPLLYAVDTHWVLEGVHQKRAPGFPLSLIAQQKDAMRDTLGRVHRFAADGGEVLLCHDPAQTPYDWTPDV
ncbi:MAG: MBL fold metallo-hydrolase [Pseudomonadota bacterium]